MTFQEPCCAGPGWTMRRASWASLPLCRHARNGASSLRWARALQRVCRAGHAGSRNLEPPCASPPPRIGLKPRCAGFAWRGVGWRRPFHGLMHGHSVVGPCQSQPVACGLAAQLLHRPQMPPPRTAGATGPRPPPPPPTAAARSALHAASKARGQNFPLLLGFALLQHKPSYQHFRGGVPTPLLSRMCRTSKPHFLPTTPTPHARCCCR